MRLASESLVDIWSGMVWPQSRVMETMEELAGRSGMGYLLALVSLL